MGAFQPAGERIFQFWVLICWLIFSSRCGKYTASPRGKSASFCTGCLLNYSGEESDAFSIDIDDSGRSYGDVP